MAVLSGFPFISPFLREVSHLLFLFWRVPKKGKRETSVTSFQIGKTANIS